MPRYEKCAASVGQARAGRWSLRKRERLKAWLMRVISDGGWGWSG